MHFIYYSYKNEYKNYHFFDEIFVNYRKDSIFAPHCENSFSPKARVNYDLASQRIGHVPTLARSY